MRYLLPALLAVVAGSPIFAAEQEFRSTTSDQASASTPVNTVCPSCGMPVDDAAASITAYDSNDSVQPGRSVAIATCGGSACVTGVTDQPGYYVAAAREDRVARSFGQEGYMPGGHDEVYGSSAGMEVDGAEEIGALEDASRAKNSQAGVHSRATWQSDSSRNEQHPDDSRSAKGSPDQQKTPLPIDD
ncbi:MAG: hypothetical protein H0W72_13145 [Planctomycetes bacterium]|nr:hypothetical protein [Planctomycetota bacterium]